MDTNLLCWAETTKKSSVIAGYNGYHIVDNNEVNTGGRDTC